MGEICASVANRRISARLRPAGRDAVKKTFKTLGEHP
jgi:hypothetical protein